MVTLQFLSDFHLEHRHASVKYEEFLNPGASDVLGLLGDIGSPYDPKLAEFIGWCSRHWRHVLYVPGNHEYYTNTPTHTLSIIHSELQRICDRFPNVRLFHNQTFELGDVLFIGSTLWSNIPNEKEAFLQNYLNDFRLIYATPHVPITPAACRHEFEKNVKFIQEAVQQAKSKGKKAVVFTHHAPSMHETSAPQYAQSDSRYGFSSELSCHHDPSAIRLWCCGHTHYNFHHHKEGYELRSNQVGYSRPVAGYDKDLVIQL